MAAAQSPALVDSIDQYLRAELVKERIPGMSVALLRGDSILLARGYGYANLEHHVPASESTVYQVGSVSKQFTAAAIVLLSEQGRLSLDDPIVRYLPEGSAVWPAVTIRHLLTHTSGIPDEDLDWRRDYTEQDLAHAAAAQPLVFAPGDRESYSSIGYALLGIIIHRVTGTFYGDFLRDHIFRPLGMSSARVISERDIVPNRAAGYYFEGDTLKNQEWVSPSLNTRADLGLSFSARDLARWAVGLNHRRLLGRAGWEASWTPLRLNDGGTYPYGLGWHITQQRGYRRIGHSGTWQGFQATIQRYPDFDTTVIVLANLAQANPEAVAFAIAGRLHPELTPPHLLPVQRSGPAPPTAIDRLLRDIATGRDSSEVTAGFRSSTPDSRRKQIAGWLEAAQHWTFIGCDAVRARGISELGTPIQHICYAKGAGAIASLLATVRYTPDWRAAGVNVYGFYQ